MDNKKAVVVLAPNGRRQTVKVNPNATVLQILEEVCIKQGLKPEEYDIKHHNKCLDTSTIFRFSGLPNNAQLELAQATKIRTEGTVILGLQLENGTRLTGNFTPGNSLWDVLLQLCPEETNLDSNLVVIYMRREIYGKSSFLDTTLRSLGLMNGRAILRIIHRSPEELRTQANVATVLPVKPVEEKPYVRKLKRSTSPIVTPNQDEKPAPTSNKCPNEDNMLNNQQCKTSKPEKSSQKAEHFVNQYVKQEKQKKDKSPRGSDLKHKIHAAAPMDVDSDTPEKENTVAEEDFVFLGARNAMIFSQEMAHTIPTEDLPEDFFELTITDAKKLLRDIRKSRLEMENAPLQTSALRNLQQTTRQLCQLNRYKQCIIRINFPDHTVLQGTFNPGDTINTVLEFVREYLDNKTMDFYLYTAPPKKILDASSQLLEIGCVPNALLHFGTKVLTKNEKYLRSDLTSKFTTPSIASLAAAKMRTQNTRVGAQAQVDLDDEMLEIIQQTTDDVNVGASTSTGTPMYEDYPSRNPKEAEKMPKWFKQTK